MSIQLERGGGFDDRRESQRRMVKRVGGGTYALDGAFIGLDYYGPQPPTRVNSTVAFRGGDS